MLRRIMALLMVAVLSLTALPAQAAEYQRGRVTPDSSTIPVLVSAGDTGQILPDQKGPYASFRHAYAYTVSDPSILTVADDGTWKALKNGVVDLSFYPRDQNTASPEFEAEMKAAGFEYPAFDTDEGYVWTYSVTVDKQIPVYRLYNLVSHEHLYTPDENEKNVLSGMRDWTYEGIAWRAAKSTGTPVIRLYNHGIGQHHYTSDANEIKVLAGRGWANEGVVYYSAGSTPVNRLYHKAAMVHLLTTDQHEANTLEAGGWHYEGTTFQVK